jgi:hypothetical protein
VDASGHVCRDNRAEVFALDGSFIFGESSLSISVDGRNILEITFASLRVIRRIVSLPGRKWGSQEGDWLTRIP